MPRIFGDIAVASEGVSKVEKMVNDSGIRSLSVNRIEAVVSFGIRVIEPRKQNRESAKIAAAVVRNQVIWIIVAHELVSERSNDAARYRKTGISRMRPSDSTGTAPRIISS